MMAGPSRMDRLTKMLGGEENLPPKLDKPSTPEADAKAVETLSPDEDPFSKLPSVDDVLNETQTSQINWWDAPLHLTQPIQQSQANPPATPFTYQDGEVTFASDPRKGEPAPLGLSFSPLLAVSKFCYKFVRQDLQQPLATAFFDAGKVWNREWDVYYIWSGHYPTAKAVTFIPEHQLLALIDEINEAFPDAKITLSDDLREEGLVINFDDLRQELRPCRLGRSTSRAQLDFWVNGLPSPTHVTMSPGDRSLEAFKIKMELANEVAKTRKKAAGKRRQAENLLKRQDMVKAFLRAQRYLGLLPKKEEESLLPDISSLSISPINPAKPSPQPFDLDVIFIAIDVEAYERAPRQITEVGVATLDTRDLHGKVPDSTGADWQQHIRARHFRIAEYAHLVNCEFVQGCPDHFDFGESEFVGKDSIAKYLTSCFHQPFSGPTPTDEKRNIVLVGQDIGQDINYLHRIGFSVLDRGNLVETLDTASMFRVYTHDPNPRSLGNILYEFDLAGWHLHNAGNDAVYTLWAMLALCVRAASERGSAEVERKLCERVEVKTGVAVEMAKERVKDEADGWTALDEDGGVAVSPSEADFESKNGKAGRKAENGHAQGGLWTIGGVPLDV